MAESAALRCNCDDDASMRQRRLAVAVRLSQALVRAAHKQDWARFLRVQNRRQRLLTDCFATPPSVAEAANVRHAVERVLTLDRELCALIGRARTDLLVQLQELRRNEHARRAYGGDSG